MEALVSEWIQCKATFFLPFPPAITTTGIEEIALEFKLKFSEKRRPFKYINNFFLFIKYGNYFIFFDRNIFFI